MADRAVKSTMIDLLNDALARELQVSVQYMLQHGIGAGWKSGNLRLEERGKPFDFVASQALYFLPGERLKKVAIIEMRHAEEISERIVHLGGTPVSEPDENVISDSIADMLADDLEQERQAIALYEKIIAQADEEADAITRKLFTWILRDEKAHYRLFSKFL